MKKFTSIKYPLAIDTNSGQLAKEGEYAAHVVQMIKQVLLTNPGERIDRPDFGCGLRRMIFAPNSEVSAALAQVSIVDALQRWLGTAIKVDDVKVTAQDETLEVQVSYWLKVTQEKQYLNLEVTP